MRITKTERGFEIIHFFDRNSQICSLQQSSLADYEPPGGSAIWFGRVENRMHIDLEQMKDLLPHLKRWVKKGQF